MVSSSRSWNGLQTKSIRFASTQMARLQYPLLFQVRVQERSSSILPGWQADCFRNGSRQYSDGSAISSYTVLPDVTLGVVSQSVATDGAANCWNTINPDGNRVYASNAGTSTIAGFAIGDNGVLTPLNGTIVGSNPEGSTNLDIAISGDGSFLYSLNGKVGSVGVFLIQSDGTLRQLTQIEGLPQAAGFNGIAAL